MRSACIDCTDRKVGCHATCDKYKEYVERGNAIKRARIAEAKRNKGSIAYERNTLRKLRGKN